MKVRCNDMTDHRDGHGDDSHKAKHERKAKGRLEKELHDEDNAIDKCN